jgi:hypothetical protein
MKYLVPVKSLAVVQKAHTVNGQTLTTAIGIHELKQGRIFRTLFGKVDFLKFSIQKKIHLPQWGGHLKFEHNFPALSILHFELDGLRLRTFTCVAFHFEKSKIKTEKSIVLY